MGGNYAAQISRASEVAEVASHTEWLAPPADDRARRRYVLLSYHEDPITRFGPALVVQEASLHWTSIQVWGRDCWPPTSAWPLAAMLAVMLRKVCWRGGPRPRVEHARANRRSRRDLALCVSPKRPS